MAILISHREIDKVIHEAISNDSLSEDSFAVIDSKAVETKPYVNIMREIFNISQVMNWIKNYDQYPMRKFEYPFAYLATPLVEGMRVLDAGCSIDPFAPFLASNGLIAYGIDNFVSHNVSWDPELGIFQGRYTGFKKVQVYAELLKTKFNISVNYHKNDMASTDFDAGYFERIFCISVLEHLSRYKINPVFDEWRRILSRDGLVIITVDYVTQGKQNFNIGDVLKEVGFTLQGKVSIFPSPNLPAGVKDSGYPWIIAAFVVKPQQEYRCTNFSRIYRKNVFGRILIDQIYKRAGHLARILRF